MLDLSPYLTRPNAPEIAGTRDVFAVHNVPHEILSSLFGKYSRMPHGLREEMRRQFGETQDGLASTSAGLDVSSEKAQKFHALYTLGYGHGSIGDGAYIHIAIENCSMLAAKVLLVVVAGQVAYDGRGR